MDSYLPLLLSFLLGGVCVLLAGWWPFLKNMRRRIECEATLDALQYRTETLEQERAELGAQFTSLAHDVLHKSNDQFLQLAGERFKQWQIEEQGTQAKRHEALQEMVKPVQRQLDMLQENIAKLSGIGGKLADDIDKLNRETGKLSNALRNPVARGQMGEVLLQRLLDLSGLVKGVHYFHQETLRNDDGETLRPDISITLGGQLNLFIDAKTPFGDIIDTLQDTEHFAATAEQVALRVREHIKALSKKEYWKLADGPDFVVLFLPTELLYSLAMQSAPGLLDEAADKRIILASPMLLLALLRMLGLFARLSDTDKSAQELMKLGQDLHHALSDVLEDWGKLGRQMDTATKSYNAALKGLEQKVMPLAEKFEDIQAIPANDRLTLPAAPTVTVRDPSGNR